MACKLVLWREIKMINYPVHYDEELGGIYDKSCHFICDVSSKTHGNEIVKRINMHDELVAMLKDIALIDGGSICIRSKLAKARELLEKCK
jgi:hypothetical protein